MSQARTIWITLGLMLFLVVLPLVLREDTNQVPNTNARRLVIYTPHSESIRREFAEAFAEYWEKQHHEKVYIDWRSPGGTSEIRLVLDASYKAADEEKRPGIGADIFFGGGEPDFANQSKKGRLVPLKLFDKHPEWFGKDGAIPEIYTGERLYAKDKTWISSCLSRFGICYNPIRWNYLGLPEPKTWNELMDPKLYGMIALADPTKSGSVARAFELIVQAEMQKSLVDPALKDLPEKERLAIGWKNGLKVLQGLAANARYFADASTKIPLDIADGNAVAGMCVDYYGKAFANQVNKTEVRLKWIAPVNGTTVSGDPIAVLRGTSEPELAQAFVEYVLSPAGQALWNSAPGTPGGPKRRELYRPPVRRDTFPIGTGKPAPDSPYVFGEYQTYRPELTAASFGTLRRFVRVMCIDNHEELKSAWEAIIEAGMPADAIAALQDFSSMPYRDGGKGDPELDNQDPLVSAQRMSQLGIIFRENYKRAEALARAHTYKKP